MTHVSKFFSHLDGERVVVDAPAVVVAALEEPVDKCQDCRHGRRRQKVVGGETDDVLPVEYLALGAPRGQPTQEEHARHLQLRAVRHKLLAWE